MYQTAIQNPLHSAIHIVGKTSDVESLDITRYLYDCNGCYIADDQYKHIREDLGATQNIYQIPCHFTLEPRSRQESQVIDQP